MNQIKLLILDVDGVLTKGVKVYDKDHTPVYKEFMCKDFTAIKRFIAAGIDVVMISGDEWNRTMAEKRNIPFFCTRDNNFSLDKSKHLDSFSEMYNLDRGQMAFVGDDYFDLSMFEVLDWSFCPSDAPNTIKEAAHRVLQSKGGEGVIVELYDIASEEWIIEASMEEVLELDTKELASAEMK